MEIKFNVVLYFELVRSGVNTTTTTMLENMELQNGSLQHYGTYIPRTEHSLYKGQAKYDKDRKMFPSLNSELVSLNGIPISYYMTSYDKNHDPIFGEDNNRVFVRKFVIMVLSEDGSSPGTNQFTWDDGGITTSDTITILTSKRHFMYASTLGAIVKTQEGEGSASNGFTFNPNVKHEQLNAPRIGDCVRIHASDEFMEIVSVYDAEEFLLSNDLLKFELKQLTDNQITPDSNMLDKETLAEIMRVSGRLGDDLFATNNNSRIKQEKENIAFIPKKKNTSSDYDILGEFWDS